MTVFEPPYGTAALRDDAQPRAPAEADVAVIGGGIVGAAAAYNLATRGVKVVLLEKGRIASEQSGRNWGFVRQQGRDPAELPLAMKANRIWRRLGDELETDIGWTQGGQLALTDEEDRAEKYEEWARMAAGLGLDTRLVTMEEVSRLVPGLQGDWLRGLYTPSDGHANPVRATVALAQAARDAGATVLTEVVVEAIELAGGRVDAVRTTAGRVRCGTAVVAAGIWSSRLAAGVGVDLPQGIVTNSVGATEALPALTRAGVWTRELAFRQLADGRLLLSAGTVTEVDAYINPLRHARLFMPMYWRNRDSFKLRFHHLGSVTKRLRMRRFGLPQPAPNQRMLRAAAVELERRFPGLPTPRLAHAWAGYIDGTPDGLPVIEALERPRGLVVATGFSGHGFAMGPAAGAVVADLIVEGRTDVDLKPMRLGRFADGSFEEPKSLL